MVSENELKPNQFRCLEIHLLLPYNWSKTGLWLAQQTHDVAKQRWFFSLKTYSSTHHKTQMMMFWPRYNDLFTTCWIFSLIYIQFHVIFLRINPSMESWSPYSILSFFVYFYKIKLALKKRSLTYILLLTF